jgi:hypothetical protein
LVIGNLGLNLRISRDRPSNDMSRPNIVVVQLVEALRYKLEGRGFDSRWCHWIFSLM